MVLVAFVGMLNGMGTDRVRGLRWSRATIPGLVSECQAHMGLGMVQRGVGCQWRAWCIDGGAAGHGAPGGGTLIWAECTAAVYRYAAISLLAAVPLFVFVAGSGDS